VAHTTKTLFDLTFTVPEDGDTNWGNDVRNLLIKIIDALQNMASMQESGLPFLVLKGTDTSITDPAGAAPYTMSVVSNRHDVEGDSAARTIDILSTTNIKDGQTLLLVGQDNTKTVKLEADNDSTSKYVINGDMLLGENDAIFLSFDSASGQWFELSRST